MRIRMLGDDESLISFRFWRTEANGASLFLKNTGQVENVGEMLMWMVESK